MAGVYAHRGASIEFPENTLAAFRRAVELGVEGMELDVHLSADGHLIVMHDETVDRTTNGSGALAEMTLEQIKKLDAGNGETVPTLGEVLDLVGDSLHVDIEVKANAAGAAVLEELAGRNTRWLISSFKWDVLQYVRSRDADADLWPLTVGASDDAIAMAKEIGAPALAISSKGMDEDIAQYLKEQELDFWVWTVNDPDEAIRLADWGAIGICTDDPARIQKAFAERKSNG
ncbi:MAG TPA: glycerophosphodiester phosphodiesterase family protein [Thermomicrobiales bacterium]|nr:glycerophosphodiester phosphodiesterase family protein [Thermomicrobiales bacterium]